MKNKYDCISLITITKTIIIVVFATFSNLITAQLGVQAPSIRTGVEFQWADTQANNSNPATIQSITIDDKLYNTFVVPSSYEMTRLGPDGNGANQIKENSATPAGNSGVSNWNSLALSAFQDQNLNHYFTANPNGWDFCGNFNAANDPLSTAQLAQKQTIFYNPSIPSNTGGVLAVTERGGNNCFYIEVWGIPLGGGSEQKLGDTFVRTSGNYYDTTPGAPNLGSDYWKSGRKNENGQTISIGLFYLNDLAPTGSSITRIVFVGSSRDHGDGKFFLLQKYAVDQQLIECLDEAYNGDLTIQNNAPENSAYTLIDPPSNVGESFILNTDGTYTYTPSPGFTGDVTFSYQLCLPFPNESVCDSGKATLSYVDYPPTPTFNIGCNSTNDNFSITVTSPLNTNSNQYEYSIDNGLNYQTDTTFTGLTETSFSLTVKNTYTNCDRTSTTSVIIPDNLELTGTIMDDNVVCKSDPNGSINISVSGGTPPYSYLWSNSAVSEDLENLTANTYTVVVTDSNGCSISDDFEITSTSDNTDPSITVPNALDVVGCDENSITSANSRYPFNTTQSNNIKDTFTSTGYSANDDSESTILSITYIDIVTPNTSCPLVVTRRYTIEDICGNSTDATQTISVLDNIDPTINTVASNKTVECDGDNSAELIAWLSSNGGATASDNCSSITWLNDFTDFVSTCGAAGSGLVTFIATDECGNESSTSASFIVVDTTPPTLVGVPDNIDVECTNIPPATEVTATDNCSRNTLNVAFTETREDGSCAGNYKLIRTWTATDDCNNSASKSQTINVTTPSLVISDVQNLTVNACDYSDQAALNTAFESWIAGFTVSGGCNPQATGISGLTAPDLCDGGATVVTYNVTDLCESGQDTATFTVTKPAALVISDVQNLTVNACDYSDQAALNMAFASWIAGFTVSGGCNPQATDISGLTAPDLCDGGATAVTYNVTDLCESGQDTATFTVTKPTTLVISDVSNETIVAGTYTTQNDLDAAFATWLTNFTVRGGCNPLGQFATTYTAPALCGGYVDIQYNVTDLCESGLDIATFTVEGADALVISDVQNLTVNACDYSDQAALNTAFESWIAGFTVSGGVTPNGQFAATYTAPALCDGGATVVTYNVTDLCESGQDTATFTVIPPTPIVFDQQNLPIDVIDIECNEVPEAEVLTASTSCGNVNVIYAEIRINGKCPSYYELKRTWTAIDECGLKAIHTQSITVQDTTPPVLDLPVNLTAQCSDDLSPIIFGTATATDNCDSSPIVAFNDVRTDGACSGTYTITRTWTATDACGNIATANQIISTSDTTAPDFDQTTLPEDIVVECNAIPTAEILTATDNCGNAVVTVEDVRTDGNCDYNYTIKRTYTATDDCGLTKTHIQTITVQDTIPPTFIETTLPAANLVVECDSIPAPETLTATDSCSSASVTVSDTKTDESCPNSYKLIRTWTATDECGLTTTHTQTITVKDTTPPTFDQTPPRDVTVECDNIPDVTTVTASDNCGNSVVSVSDVKTNGNCPSNYFIARTWTATDECGLTTKHTQIITVQDTKAPTPKTTYDETLDVSCTNIPDALELEFEDNCSSNITVIFNETNLFNENVFEDYQIIRTWTVSDECNNEAIYTQTLNVTLDEIYSEIVAEDRCYDEGIVNLNNLISDTLNTTGTWELLEGNPTAVLNGSIFDPTTLELSEDFLPGSGGINYRFRYTTTNDGCISITEVTMNVHADCVVLPCGENDIVISKAITPNGDGYNETFDIEGIDLCGFVAELKIFNRWGALVYESNNYTLGSIKTSGAKGDWDGSSPSSSIGASGKLPNGTYYYIIKLRNSGLSPLTGPIYLGTK
ncbi:gliding motility-associated C-terminal domain-containing protein [Flaviramulus basaltis]|uniref:Gliding motility-associated C-terminal domain-containing protein n=1 Tax=Flaviramulus basaltis TaxID=369401 RepID=A0A1K2IGQ4_9FLAO|nr:gliding motility-associated C-terminal domain-containing protein [Flaviramulus basaltis]SFZ91470.1 gliding motility-associated C-terminal domain-containing protein [Flaviramulus basaltis]